MPSLEDNTTQVGSYTDNRHIIPVNSQGFFQTPQDIMEEYNGCSVPQYTAYRSETHFSDGPPIDAKSDRYGYVVHNQVD